MVTKEIKLCKQAVVLDTLKKTKGKGGMTSAQIKLAEAQAEDYADMKKELQGLKSDVSDVKKEVEDVKVKIADIGGKVDVLLENSKIKSKLIDNKYFWIFLTVFACLFAGVTHLSELKAFFGG